jgi:hypothetical protein
LYLFKGRFLYDVVSESLTTGGSYSSPDTSKAFARRSEALGTVFADWLAAEK